MVDRVLLCAGAVGYLVGAALTAASVIRQVARSERESGRRDTIARVVAPFAIAFWWLYWGFRLLVRLLLGY